MAKEEIWKPVLGYEESYKVSSKGRIRSLDRVKVVGGLTQQEIGGKFNIGRRQIGCIKDNTIWRI